MEKTYGDDPFTWAIENEGEGSGAITYSSGNEAIATVNPSTGEVTILAAGNVFITATKEADNDYDGATAEYQLIVAPRSVTITGLSAGNKIYDGLTTATVLGTAVLDGRLDKDELTLTLNHGTASFASRDVNNIANPITVTFSGYSLGGDSAPNYILSGQPTNFTANITARTLTISAPDVVLTKTYNGNANATINHPEGGSDANLSYLITNLASNAEGISDTVTLAGNPQFNSPNVTEADSISITFNITGGTDAGNYLPPDVYTIDEGISITKALGAAVTVPTAAIIEFDRIISSTVELVTATGQDAEYAISTMPTPPTADSAWQFGTDASARTFTGLSGNTDYYLFARSRANDNYNAGEPSVSAKITTLTETFSGGLTLNITTNIPDLAGVDLTVSDDFGMTLNLNAAHTVTFTVSDEYDLYRWVIGSNNDIDIVQGADVHTFTIRAVNYTPGNYQLMVIVHKYDIPYSASIYFTVLN